MKILAHAFTMIPTNDLAGTAAAYVADGLEILWRPDPQTAIVGANERAFVMIEDDPYVQTVQEEELDVIVDDAWDPPVTLGARLVSIADDASQHAGQAAYLKGLLDG